MTDVAPEAWRRLIWQSEVRLSQCVILIIQNTKTQNLALFMTRSKSTPIILLLVAQALLPPLQAFLVVTSASRGNHQRLPAKSQYFLHRDHVRQKSIGCRSRRVEASGINNNDDRADTPSAPTATNPSSYIPDDSLATQKFLDFLEAEECEGLDRLDIGFSSQQHLQGMSPLRGIFAKESFQVGDFLCAIPFVSTCVVGEERILMKEVGTTKDDDIPRPQMTDADNGLSFLQLSEDPKWQPYVSCLPTRNAHFDATPDFWKEEELEQLEIPFVIQSARERREKIELLAGRMGVDVDKLQFATWLITSRAFTTIKPIINSDSSSEGESLQDHATSLRMRTVLIPFLDMINHVSHQPNAEVEVVDTKRDDESFYALRAIRPIQAGEQVWITYGTGKETSVDLLARYGFVAVDDVNLNDVTDISGSSNNLSWITTLEEDESALVSAEGVMKKILQTRVHLKRLQKLTAEQQPT